MDLSANLHEVMFEYSKNIRDYNNNIRIYLDIIAGRERTYSRERTESTPFISPLQDRFSNNRTNHTNHTNHTNTNIFSRIRNQRLPRQSEFLSNLLDPFITNQNTNLQNVIVRPTTEQILYATDIVLFDESMSNNNTICPITLDSFENGEEICRIRHCSHLFKRNALHDWFRENVRCPICRFDIRDYQGSEEEQEEEQEQEEQEEQEEEQEQEEEEQKEQEQEEEKEQEEFIIEPIRQSITNPFTRNFTSALRTFVNNELANLSPSMNSVASELLYTFDIPLLMDISGNFRI